MTTPTTNKPDAIEQILGTLTILAMDRGNLYDGYVASAEFNAECLRVGRELIPEALAAIYKEIERVCAAVIGDDNIPYMKLEPCPACGAAYMYQCSCSTASDYLEAKMRSRLTKALEDMKGEES